MKRVTAVLVGWEPDERNGVILTIDGVPVMRPVFKTVELPPDPSATVGVFCDACQHWFPGKPGDRHECLAALRAKTPR